MPPEHEYVAKIVVAISWTLVALASFIPPALFIGEGVSRLVSSSRRGKIECAASLRLRAPSARAKRIGRSFGRGQRYSRVTSFPLCFRCLGAALMVSDPPRGKLVKRKRFGVVFRGVVHVDPVDQVFLDPVMTEVDLRSSNGAAESTRAATRTTRKWGVDVRWWRPWPLPHSIDNLRRLQRLIVYCNSLGALPNEK